MTWYNTEDTQRKHMRCILPRFYTIKYSLNKYYSLEKKDVRLSSAQLAVHNKNCIGSCTTRRRL